jgi:hypothetical protein
MIAVVGALASLPVTLLLEWLPDSGATVGGGIMIVGAFLAGAIATTRGVEPSAVGLRTGALAALVAAATPVGRVFGDVAAGNAAAWPLPRVAFLAAAGVTVLLVTPLFGLVCARVGGWVAATLGSRRRRDTNAS